MVEGYDDATIGEHCKLLVQQGLIEDMKIVNSRKKNFSFRVSILTAAGYDYLEIICKDKSGAKSKRKLKRIASLKPLPSYPKSLVLSLAVPLKKALNEI